ncbi:NAD(P)H-binding protein [Phycicoccus sp. Soil802]|uniref:NAD(P)H-binding protein n=1 Tax=Phycicoccus sp. Soil802 TaxID=1736414 RepID=UPI000703B084|nr:NAD(P)H-binding protein [Phycicoccus sp. Soil802]KRF29785.1 NAD-dependent dehydratase [Phycicoccus sp. Soil802]
MIVVIAGGHGQIALHLERFLADAGHEPVGLVRNPDHLADLAKQGARGEVVDLEKATVDQLAAAVAGADAVVFAAGAGPGSGADRKETVDRAAAALLADAAEQAGVTRYLMVSAMGTERADPDSDDVFQVYLRAKGAADDDLRARTALEWTVVRPGRLTDDEPTGRVTLGEGLDRGSVTRRDVAAVLAELLVTGAGRGRTVDLVSGKVPVEQAVAALGS